jgi:hypothetical protein
LRINTVSPFMQHVMVSLIDDLRERYPLIELERNGDDHIIDLPQLSPRAGQPCVSAYLQWYTLLALASRITCFLDFLSEQLKR